MLQRDLALKRQSADLDEQQDKCSTLQRETAQIREEVLQQRTQITKEMEVTRRRVVCHICLE